MVAWELDLLEAGGPVVYAIGGRPAIDRQEAMAVIQADRQEDSGYFFKRIGELCFTAEHVLRSCRPEGAGGSQLAASNAHGLVAFADGKGAACYLGGCQAREACVHAGAGELAVAFGRMRRAVLLASQSALLCVDRASITVLLPPLLCAGLYVARTEELVSRLQKWDDEDT